MDSPIRLEKFYFKIKKLSSQEYKSCLELIKNKMPTC